MTSIGSKPGFMTGIHYLDQLQYHAKNHGDMLMINRRFEFGKNLYSKDLFAHYGCVNAIEFSNDGEWLVSGGDDKRVLIWNINKTLSGSYQPKAMKGEHNSNIFCLGFSKSHAKLFSAGNDEQVILHDVATGEIQDVFFHDEAVYGLSVDPVNESIFASACDDGRVLIWDIRVGPRAFNEPFTLATCSSAYHAVMYNPVEPRFLATANAKDGVYLWDIRVPKIHVMKYGPTLLSQSAMSVRFNSVGTHLLALRRRFPPVLYEITSPQPAAEFDHQEYYNSCTMKSCCFAGDKDQYILSGSDDFKLYVWKIPDSANTKKGVWVSKAHFVLRGHRSIVNQVRYNNTYGLLASSGVEKIVKLWSSFPLSFRDDCEIYKDSFRKVYSHEEYINLVLESGQFMTHDYSHHSVQEDPRMMAFFDSLVQRDIEGWTSDSSNAETANTCYVVQSSESLSSSSSSSSDEETQSNESVKESRNTSDGAPSRKHSPKSAKSLSYVTKRALANEHSENSSSVTEENADPSLDIISKLIAQKRREQMLKTTRACMKGAKKNCKLVKKGLEFLKKHKSDPLISGNVFSENSAENCPQKKLSLLKSDKRKLLRKKRAKLSKDPVLEQKSTDSEDSAGEMNTDTVNSNCSNKTEEKPVSDKLIKNENETNNNGLLPQNNVSTNDGLNNVSNSTNNESTTVNGSDTSLSAIITNSIITFCTKGSKRNSRNYRKRSADDVEDD